MSLITEGVEDVQFSFGQDCDGIFTAHRQHIDTKFLDALRKYRDDTSGERCGEHLRVASVPTIFIHQWLREGFDAYNAPLKEVVKRLKAQGLDAFLTTDKTVH